MKCKRPLDYQTLAEGPDNDVSNILHNVSIQPLVAQIYCKNCYSYTYGHKSKATLHEADCTQLQGEEGGADVCPRCSGKVENSKTSDPSLTTNCCSRCLRRRSRSRSQEATTGSASPALSANTRWIPPTLPTDRTTRCLCVCVCVCVCVSVCLCLCLCICLCQRPGQREAGTLQ